MFLSKKYFNYRSILFIRSNLKLKQNSIIINRNFSIFSRNETKPQISNILPNIDDKVVNFYLPEPPSGPEFVESVETLNRLGEATFASLGLNSNWPTGWMQAAYETLHVNFDLPWWSVIALSAVFIRAVMFPVSIKIKKMSIINNDIAPKMMEIKRQIEIAKLSNDMLTMSKCVMDYKELSDNQNYKPIQSAIYPMLQLPLFFTVMMGLRQMAVLPVASLQTGGLFWFTDLTMCDPYYILPITTMGLVLLQMEMGADFARNFSSLYAKWGIRAMPAIGLAVTCNLPSALLLYWWFSSFLSVSLAAVMKIPVVKQKLGLRDELIVRAVQTTKSQGFVKDFKQKSQERRTFEKVKKLESLQNDEWVKAGTGAVPKTYSYDPTKVKSVN